VLWAAYAEIRRCAALTDCRKNGNDDPALLRCNAGGSRYFPISWAMSSVWLPSAFIHLEGHDVDAAVCVVAHRYTLGRQLTEAERRYLEGGGGARLLRWAQARHTGR